MNLIRNAQAFDVDLANRRYTIHIGHGLAAGLARLCQQMAEEHRPIAIVTDRNFADEQASFLRTAFGGRPTLILPAGETTKDLAYLERVYTFLAQNRMDRTGAVFALGGGVTGDLVGFAAATYLRGIGFYQVPTTLLAMVDSSVGGKTGINIPEGKNLVGAFYQPDGVFIDTRLLETLPPREFSAGMAEVIKYGMLGDLAFFERLERMDRLAPAHPDLPDVIRLCCQHKADVVRQDEQERADAGGRALLNLGHTFGHAIEKVAGYGVYLHGEAVAVGLVLATRLSIRLGLIDADVERRVVDLLLRYDLPIHVSSDLDEEDLLATMRSDKKVKQGRMRLIVLEALGRAATHTGVSEDLIREVWREGRKRDV